MPSSPKGVSMKAVWLALSASMRELSWSSTAAITTTPGRLTGQRRRLFCYSHEGEHRLRSSGAEAGSRADAVELTAYSGTNYACGHMATSTLRNFLFAVALLSIAVHAHARPADASACKGFDRAASIALQTMKAKAEEQKIGGAAVLACFEGDSIQSWSSKMLVVGRMKDEPTATGKGSNLLGIAYAKAAEMADTLKDSGSGVRPPMLGEYGWKGGVIVPIKGGHIIAAFSGGKSEQDAATSRVGAAKIVEEMKRRRLW